MNNYQFDIEDFIQNHEILVMSKRFNRILGQSEGFLFVRLHISEVENWLYKTKGIENECAIYNHVIKFFPIQNNQDI